LNVSPRLKCIRPESILFKPLELAKKIENIVFPDDPLFEAEVDAIVA
jgi:hypothetical protein